MIKNKTEEKRNDKILGYFPKENLSPIGKLIAISAFGLLWYRTLSFIPDFGYGVEMRAVILSVIFFIAGCLTVKYPTVYQVLMFLAGLSVALAIYLATAPHVMNV